MALTKVTGKGLDNNVVDSTKLSTNSVTETKIASGAVTSAKISDGTVSADDLSSTLDLSSKTVTLPTTSVTAAMLSSTLDLSSKTVTLPTSATATLDQNIALLGFKMAITDGLTVFNLVDGVVDEFEDESGVDNSASTNANYCATNDVYSNNLTAGCVSAGFTTNSITEPDTSTAGTNPAPGSGTYGSFIVPNGMTSLNIFTWGAGGGSGPGTSISGNCAANNRAHGGGGGYSTGKLAVTSGQTLTIVVGEGGDGAGSAPIATFGGGLGGYRPSPAVFSPISQPNLRGGGGIYPSSVPAPDPKGENGHGGGLAGVFTNSLDNGAPVAVIIAGAGGGGTFNFDRPDFNPQTSANPGGAGGGLQGLTVNDSAQTSSRDTFTSHPGNTTGTPHGGGGSQSAGGQGGIGAPSAAGGPNSKLGQTGGLFYGGNNYVEEGDNYSVGSGGGAGYYGGGGGAWEPGISGTGGGGSSYYGHPQVTCGATEAGSLCEGGGLAIPSYVASTNEGGTEVASGEDGYVFLTGSFSAFGLPGGGSSTIISDPFTANTVPTTARIVVFEENVDTPSLNTDIIASISRNNGSNYTTATLTDSGYVTGSSGQRILTGTATISGQPSGQSMRWKLELANNTVKIHGVALQWK
jgi:hypothetical protein